MNKKLKNNAQWRHVVLLIILILAVYVLAPRFNAFHSSIDAIKEANHGLLALALGASLTAVLCAALTYKQLIFKQVPYTRIVSVQYAGMFINRLIPAGIGGISLFIDFLYRQGHSLARASGVVAMNTSIGLLGHLTLFAVILAICGTHILPNEVVHFEKALWLGLGLVILVAVFIVVLRSTKPLGAISTFFHQVGTTFALYRKRKIAVARALMCAMLNTAFHALSLFLAMQAFGVDLHAASALVVLTGGVFAATITPTPGGVLGAEAGLTAALMAYGIDSNVAFAVAISYRLVSYWLPIIPGIIVFLYVQKRKYI